MSAQIEEWETIQLPPTDTTVPMRPIVEPIIPTNFARPGFDELLGRATAPTPVRVRYAEGSPLEIINTLAILALAPALILIYIWLAANDVSYPVRELKMQSSGAGQTSVIEAAPDAVTPTEAPQQHRVPEAVRVQEVKVDNQQDSAPDQGEVALPAKSDSGSKEDAVPSDDPTPQENQALADDEPTTPPTEEDPEKVTPPPPSGYGDCKPTEYWDINDSTCKPKPTTPPIPDPPADA